MTPQEMKQLAELLQNVPGIKSIELEDVQGLAQLLRESPEIGSIEIKGWFGTGVVITRTSSTSTLPAAQAVAHALPPASPPPSGAEAREAPRAAPSSALKEIKSPMVGTFYMAPEPGADPYVKVGGRISPGQTVCIIEAMKIMNEIEAEVSGVVREILVEDAQPVEYGQVLFRIDPHG
jgi:acetyl-CoA carboxylase biotin carboxyl carrier protein